MRLLDDPNNSNDSAFASARLEMARELFKAHIKGNVQVSPRTAMIVGAFSLLGIGGFAAYVALHFNRTIFYSVLAGGLLFAVLLKLLKPTNYVLETWHSPNHQSSRPATESR